MNEILEKLSDAISAVEKALDCGRIGDAMRANDAAKKWLLKVLEEQDEEFEEIEIMQ